MLTADHLHPLLKAQKPVGDMNLCAKSSVALVHSKSELTFVNIDEIVGVFHIKKGEFQRNCVFSGVHRRLNQPGTSSADLVGVITIRKHARPICNPISFVEHPQSL